MGPQPFQRGRVIRAAALNQAAAASEAGAGLRPGPGLVRFPGPPASLGLVDDDAALPARLTGSSGGLYSWAQVAWDDAAGWVTIPGGATGTANAVELNGRAVPVGMVVWIYPGQGGTWAFGFESQGAALEPEPGDCASLIDLADPMLCDLSVVQLIGSTYVPILSLCAAVPVSLVATDPPGLGGVLTSWGHFHWVSDCCEQDLYPFPSVLNRYLRRAYLWISSSDRCRVVMGFNQRLYVENDGVPRPPWDDPDCLDELNDPSKLGSAVAPAAYGQGVASWDPFDATVVMTAVSPNLSIRFYQ